MDKRNIVRLYTIVAATAVGTIAITLVPFLFAEETKEWEEFSSSIKLLLLYLSIGLIVGAAAYIILKLFQGSNHKHRQ